LASFWSSCWSVWHRSGLLAGLFGIVLVYLLVCLSLFWSLCWSISDQLETSKTVENSRQK